MNKPPQNMREFVNDKFNNSKAFLYSLFEEISKELIQRDESAYLRLRQLVHVYGELSLDAFLFLFEKEVSSFEAMIDMRDEATLIALIQPKLGNVVVDLIKRLDAEKKDKIFKYLQLFILVTKEEEDKGKEEI